jgi:uncharacterized membrane protein YeaQ/YmgE (transglycosylase-associated protein family)
MNPSYGIIMWIIVGALAGWIGSKVMGTDARQGGLANIVVGVIGAVVGGFLATNFLGDFRGNNGFIASFFVALLGACIVLALWKAVAGRRRI